jgi:hypothetical protein
MATTFHYFTGKTKWPKIRPDRPDDYQGVKAWKIPVYLDKDNIKALQDAGLRMRPKKDEDGSFVTFRRPLNKEIGGKIVDFDPPTVIDKNNQPLDPKIIGNGSVVTVKISAFDTRMGKGHRLESVRVEELVEYKPDAQADENQAKPAVGLPF